MSHFIVSLFQTGAPYDLKIMVGVHQFEGQSQTPVFNWNNEMPKLFVSFLGQEGFKVIILSAKSKTKVLI